MCKIIAFLFVLFLIHPGLAQAPSKTQKPVKNEMQRQMMEAVNELNKQIADLEQQIAEAKKNKEDEATIKDLEDQLAMLKKQVAMMGGVTKSISGISEKTFEQAGEEEAIVAKKDVTRISMLPKKILTEAELVLFIKNVHAQVEKIMPAAEKTDALKIYNETKTKYNSSDITGNAATSCWMLGHSEKAVYIMGKACMDDIGNTDNLSNYAAFLIMSGGEQAALPILEYLNDLYPKNSTILNNMGQAWFGLGDMENSKKHLDEATLLYPGHSMANATLSSVYQSEGDNEKTISFLKASLKETYDPDKEAQLASLGYNIKFADMPPLNYPLKDDPFDFIPLMNSLPENIQTNVHDKEEANVLQSFLNGVRKLRDEEQARQKILMVKNLERDKKISNDSRYRNKFLEVHNSPGYKQAARGLQLRIIESQPVPVSGSVDDFPVEKIIENCQKFWYDSVLVPTQKLAIEMGSEKDCNYIDEKVNAYLEKRRQIYSRGVRQLKNIFIRNSRRLTEWIKYNLYGRMDDPPRDADDFTYAMIGEMQTTMGKTIYKNEETLNILSLLYGGVGFGGLYKSRCQNRQTPDPDPGADDLAPLVKSRVECEFKKRVSPSGFYSFELVCNTIIEKTDSRLPKKKPSSKNGAAESSRSRNQPGNNGPLARPRGPSILFYEDEKENIIQKTAPLNAEDKDPSQFSIEYDKWGNMIGFNFQLNKEGTALADPDSIESGIDSRWSWNAIASPKKGFLNKLLIK